MPGQNILVAVVEIKVVALIKMEAKLLSILCVISCSKCEDTYFFYFIPLKTLWSKIYQYTLFIDSEIEPETLNNLANDSKLGTESGF